MTKDVVYVFDKLTKVGSLLGEIQSNFEMSFVIDGTKDSAKIIVWSFSGVEIEPKSIVYHPKTNSWFVVDDDKIDRYQNDNGEFVWVHELSLLGAIDLTNARDLTDCGFNDNTYTISQFITRLFSLSNFEFDYTNANFFQGVSQNFLDKVVDFVKTFENYTLLVALREFLDAYNMCPKLSFNSSYNSTNDTYTINYPILEIISKTGNLNRVHQMSEFDDVRETRTMNSNSFGTIVVSNAENVISTETKTYPSMGAVRLSSKEWDITRDNAILRLPTNAYKVNWVAMVDGFHNCSCAFTRGTTPLSQALNEILDKYCYPPIRNSIYYALSQIKAYVLQQASYYGETEFAEAFEEQFDAKTDKIVEIIEQANTIRIFGDNVVNANTGDIIKGDNVPYVAEIDIRDYGDTYYKFTLVDKETKDMLKVPNQAICWNRNSNLIENFGAMTSGVLQTPVIKIKDGFSTDYQSNEISLIVVDVGGMYFEMELDALTGRETLFNDSQWRVNYIPMSDLKIKVDNQREKNDIQLYNQNGKLTDSVALSKIINSYSKEISSDTITKYAHYYAYSNIPHAGDMVLDNNEMYVINNISLSLSQNETSVSNDFGYFIECEITMSKWVSTKSLMVNPNTNIRDYGIPQNYNVKRKQLYRDYFELYYTQNGGDTNYYLEPVNIFEFGYYPSDNFNFVCQMKITYDEEINNSYDWYYQVETTTYILNKMVYVSLDFLDNNIIGYSFMNMYGAVDLSKLFDLTVNINTPITYVDQQGKFKDIDIVFLSPQNAYDNAIDFKNLVGYGNESPMFFNASCFIDYRMFEISQNNSQIEIVEQNYNKDATEVPVFEYACQIDDSDDVLIGDNILREHNGYIYFYFYKTGSNLNQNNINEDYEWEERQEIDGTIYGQMNSAQISYSYENSQLPKLIIRLYSFTRYSTKNGSWSNGFERDIPTNTDLAIFRHAYNLDTNESKVDLLFIAKNIPTSAITNSGKVLELLIHHWKLK
jgi:hypothetical protein